MEKKNIFVLIFVLILSILGGSQTEDIQNIFHDYISEETSTETGSLVNYDQQDDWFKNIPAYNGNPYVEVNNNVPFFTKEDYTFSSDYSSISELDELGRCGPAFAVLSDEDIPEEKRGDISSIKPSGWVQEKYSFNGKQLFCYNRSHLLAYSIFGLDDKRILITGTDYLNHDGMIPFETTVRDYIKSKENFGKKVLYRVTPIYENDELVCRGVLMEAASVDDKGYSVGFNVFCYNVQPGVDINYKTGETKKSKSIIPKNYYVN